MESLIERKFIICIIYLTGGCSSLGRPDVFEDNFELYQ